MASLKIGTLNVGGIHLPVIRKKLLIYLKKLQVDIAYLQETHHLPLDMEKLGTMGWKVLASVSASFSSKARGVAILIRTSVAILSHSITVDPQGRYVIADITVDQSRFTLCYVNAPNLYSKYFFFLHLGTKLYPMGDRPLLLGGGFNLVSSPRMDRSSIR